MCPSCNITAMGSTENKPTSEMRRLALAGIFVNAGVHIVLYVLPLAPFAIKGYADFASFYTAGRIVESGKAADLYDYETQWQVQQECCRVPIRSSLLPYVHAAYEALVFVPLALLPYPAAYVVWTALNVGVLLLIAFLLRQYLRPLLPHWSLLTVAAVASFPFLIMFAQGQDSLLLALIYSAVFVFLKAGRPYEAGACLSMGMFKPQLVVPFVIVLLLRKAWKPIFGFLLGAIALGIISVATMGESVVWGYFEFLRKFDRMPAEISGAWPKQMLNLRGLLAILLERFVSPEIVTGLVVLASIAVIWIASRRNDDNLESQFSFALTATMLASYHFNSHDAVLLILPAVLGFSTLRARPAKITLYVATASWFIWPAMFLLVKYSLLGVLGFLVVAFAVAFWLETPRPEISGIAG